MGRNCSENDIIGSTLSTSPDKKLFDNQNEMKVRMVIDEEKEVCK
jgi:hypothetical protein